MNRGLARSKVFLNNDDRERFLSLIGETCRLWSIEVYAYCLMNNHYHLLLQTPQGNLSRAIRHLDGIYTQRFNRAHRRDGPLFRGRYRAILIDAEEYFLAVARYIHQNPEAAGMGMDIERYRWSSHRGYLQRRYCPSWLPTKAMLSRFGQGSRGLREYRTFMRTGVQKELMEFYRERYQRPILGGKEFVRRVKEKIGEKARVRAEVPQSRKVFVHGVDEIVGATAKIYGKTVEELLKRRRGRENEAREMAIYLCRVLGGHKLEDIGKVMGLKNYSSVSSAYLAVKGRVELERRLALSARKVEELLKSQKQT
jgi:REP element-mobilizing transposase RayT